VCPVAGCPAGNVTVKVNITDVRLSAGLADYGGELQGVLPLRITDKNNGVSPGGGSEPATVTDTSLKLAVPCLATGADTSIGSTCSVSTTANAVVPAAVASGSHTIWELGQVEVYDGGSDGVAATAPNTPFARQGILLP
jgi:hypothetical protein